MGGFRYEVITEYWPLFLEGAKMTIQITVICVTLGVILGMALGMARLADARHSPWKQILKYCVRWPVTVYVSFFRGTPLFVQILLMQFAILPFFIHPTEGLLISGDLAREIRSTYGAMLAGIVAITLNAGAYLSEVFRAGIQSLDKGQMEAARSLGLSYAKSMQKIILPQAVRICLPSLVNQFIITLKDSTILYAIGLSEVMYNAKIYVGRTMESFATYTWVAVFFLLIVTVLSFISRYVERRMNA
mgnify:CR=1 FL=1